MSQDDVSSEIPELFNQVIEYLSLTSRVVQDAKARDRWDDGLEQAKMLTAVAALMKARRHDDGSLRYLEELLDADWEREAPKEVTEYMLTNLAKWQNTIRAVFGFRLISQRDLEPFINFISILQTIKST